MDYRRLRTSLAVALATVALAAAGCGTESPRLAGTWETPSSAESRSATASPPASSSPSAPPSPSSSPSAGPSKRPKTPGPKAAHRYVFPVGGKPFSYARTHHDYPATDIIASCGLPVRAATDGVVLEVSRKDLYDKAKNDGALRGGLFVSLLGDDGVRYYGAHLSAVRGGIEAGVRVRAGQQIGKVGSTGNSSACHLHFGISPPCARTGDWWVRRGVVWPYSYLDSWRAGKNRSPKAAVAAWKADHGCPRSAP
jgi:murein DD-endopeptidase MepM/ murein hydrolase activator NlpD